MIRANRSNVMKVMKVKVFLQIDSCESPRFAVRIAGSSKVGGCSSRGHDEGCGSTVGFLASMSAALSLRAFVALVSSLAGPSSHLDICGLL